MESIQEAINAIIRVLSVHENHLFPQDRESLEGAMSRLRIMQEDGLETSEGSQ